MRIGYAILHAKRVEAAISEVAPVQTRADEGVDLGVCGLVMDAPEDLIGDYLDGVFAKLERGRDRLMTLVDGAQTGAGGAEVFAELDALLAGLRDFDFAALRLTPWVDRLPELLVEINLGRVIEKVDAVLARIAVAVPELRGAGLLDALVEILLGGLDVLERPRLDGRTDLVAHRCYRAARILRAWLDGALAPARARLARFDLMAWLRASLRGLAVVVRGPDLGVLRGLGLRLQGALRPLAAAFDAIMSVRVSASLELGAEVETAPETVAAPSWLDDCLGVPHALNSGMWWLDLSSGLSQTLLGIHDLASYDPFHAPRTADALLGIVNVMWQGARTLVRALRPDFLTKRRWDSAGAFWFSELGDFTVQLSLGFLAAFHEAPMHASNWVLSLMSRLGRYFTYGLQPRVPYIYARSVAYLADWRERGAVQTHTFASGESLAGLATRYGASEWQLRVWNRLGPSETPALGTKLVVGPRTPTGDADRARISMPRLSWASWAPMLWLGGFGGFLLPWDGLALNSVGFTSGVRGPLVASLTLAGGLAFWFFGPRMIGEGLWPWTGRFELEPVYLGFYAGAAIYVLLVLVGFLAGSNKSFDAFGGDDCGALWLIVLATGLVGMVLSFTLWAQLADNKHGHGALVFWNLLIGLTTFLVIPMILWWFYVQDGRDADGRYEAIAAAADASPYKLPWTQDEVWQCYQGYHGPFSHLDSSASNHHSYDFLDAQDAPALAARGGMIVHILQGEPYGSLTPNKLSVQHFDWVPTHDLGTDLERVMTYSVYLHLAPRHVHVGLDQYVVQGQNVADIDSTGNSAAQHLHFTIALGPSDAASIPAVFADDSIRRDRTFGPLRAFDGRGHQDGRPLSHFLYRSTNARRAATARALALTTAPPSKSGTSDAAIGAHTHSITLDLARLPLDGEASGELVLWTGLGAGHRHQVRISPETLAVLLAHGTTLVETEAALIGDLEHRHMLGSEAWTGATAGGSAAKSPTAQLGVCRPPPAQLLARTDGPYDLHGTQVVVRLDDAITEFYRFGGDRPALLGDLALTRSPRTGATLDLDQVPDNAVVSASLGATGRRSVRDGARELSDALATRAWIVEAAPVLVLETRARGSATSLELDAGASGGGAALFGLTAPIQARGAGSIPRQASLGLDDLRAIFVAQLNQLPSPSPPAANLLALGPSGVDLDLGFGSTPLDSSQVQANPRFQAILAARYDAGARVLRCNGDLPLGPGVLSLSDGSNTLPVFVAGTPATLELNLASAWLGPSVAHRTTLLVAVGASEVGLRLPPSSSAAAIARAVMVEVEGVRAWALDAGRIWLETVDVGPEVTVRVRKAAPDAGADFEATAVGAAPRIRDSALVSRDELQALIDDALTELGERRAVLAGTKAAVDVRVEASRLVLEVPDGSSLSLDASASSPALVAALGLQSSSPRKLESRALATPVVLPPSGWLDLRVDGDRRRVELVAEPARLELPPLTRPPRAGDSLRVTIDGGAVAEVELAGVRSVEALAGALAATSDDLLVRVAYRVAVEGAAPGGQGLKLDVTSGRVAAGFLATTALADGRRGPSADPRACASAADFAASRTAWRGPLAGAGASYGVTSDAGGANPGVSLTALASGTTVAVIGEGGTDPFNFAGSSCDPFTTRAMGARRLTYRIERRAAGSGTVRGATQTQLCATPAAVRGVAPVDARALEGATLKVSVTSPRDSESAELRFAWAALARELPGATPAELAANATRLRTAVVAQLRRELSLVDAYLVDGPEGRARLQLETRGAGRGWALKLEGQVALGALGLGPAGASVLDLRGGGDVDDEDAVTPAELAAVFSAAEPFVTLGGDETDAAKLSNIDLPTLPRATYDAGINPTRLRLRSRGAGCRSSVVILAGGSGLDVERSWERAPASNAALVLGPIGASLTFGAATALRIRFDDDPGRERLVSFPAGPVPAAPALAELIHGQLGTWGRAAAFPDGSIVVETSTGGVQGSVEVLAPSGDEVAFEALARDGTFARGWPGSAGLLPFGNISSPLVPAAALNTNAVPARGLRGRLDGVRGPGVKWRFRTLGRGQTGDLATPEIDVSGAADIPTLIAALDAALAQAGPTPGVRIGHARAEPDGSVLIEAAAAVTTGAGASGWLILEHTAGRGPGPWVTQPARLGERADLVVEPGLGLRVTDTLRTYRLIYDRRGAGDTSAAGEFIDAGWQRPPTDAIWGVCRGRTDYKPLSLGTWARGRYLLAARTEAAQHDYGGRGEMVASWGQAGGVGFVRVARYWLSTTHDGSPGPIFVGVRVFGGELLSDWLS